ncbi:Na+/H+ antiporter subunit E [Ottowia testudinis]|uniref:Na+/H+ antiporter subunit E n=1 Tax=Ottowia testudinis TaxID=2816950 RepID=A0A975CHZ2_9BURK|nr:Na+/H+ antiporter subunit E [Ottowia testudinis]QTD46778.1 Na+/H+ antiporter subunit E [Ottowia testudinis]
MIKRLLPAPLLTAALIVMWLVLNRSVSPGQIMLAVLFGVAAPALLAPLRPARPRIRRPLVVLRLIGVVGRDVLTSSLDVFWTLLRNRSQPVHSRFVKIPLDLRDPTGLASLAMITTVVPGTVWCELARDHSALLLHVWHAPDEDAFIAHYKRAYEKPLLEIFES